MHCVVLNTSRKPLAVVSSERGLVLHLEGKALILEELPGRRFRSEKLDLPVPTQVVLTDYVKTGSRYYQPAQLNQRNLFLRDRFLCQYCGRHESELEPGEYLTRDHLQPQSRDGQDVWSNVLTSCSSCNHRKDDHTLAEFVKILTDDVANMQDRLARTTSAKQRTQAEAELGRLQTMKAAAERWQRRVPKAPTVFEILMNRMLHKRSSRL